MFNNSVLAAVHAAVVPQEAVKILRWPRSPKQGASAVVPTPEFLSDTESGYAAFDALVCALHVAACLSSAVSNLCHRRCFGRLRRSSCWTDSQRRA